jgi:hypothetical protein
MAEVALEADSYGRENFPLRKGKKTPSEGRIFPFGREKRPFRKGEFSHIIDI